MCTSVLLLSKRMNGKIQVPTGSGDFVNKRDFKDSA
jgi:hypothetical protein